MKHTFISLITILVITTQEILSQNCSGPVPIHLLRQKISQFTLPMNESVKLAQAKQLSDQYCLTSFQVRDLAATFLNETYKLEFCKHAYYNTQDKQNFYFVYDAFAYFSSVFMLHDYVLQQSSPQPSSSFSISFPPLNYPQYNQYSGMVGCREVISHTSFMEYVYQIYAQPNPASRLSLAIEITKYNCMSTEQIMKIATLFDQDIFRNNYLKAVWPHVFDKDNYIAAANVINNAALQNDFVAFIKAQQNTSPDNNVSPSTSTPQPCPISINELNDILSALKKESFNNTRLTIAKNILRSKACFTALQIREIVKVFDFENARLEIAKYAYDYCVDKNNYYTVADALQFESSKEELMKYIENR